MKRTRVVRLLNILSEPEKKLLQKHIEYSNKEVHFKAIANYLLVYCDQPNLLENENIINALNKEITEEQLGALSAQLFQFVENFALNNWLNNLNETHFNQLVQKELLLLDYYKTKELPGNHKHINNLAQLINTKQKQINKHLNTKKVDNVSHYYYTHRLNYHQYYGLNASILKDGENYIKATMHNLDVFYCLMKLKFASEINLRNLLTNEKNKVLFFEEMNSYCETFVRSRNKESILPPVIKIYQLCSALSANPTKTNLIHLKNKIIKHESSLNNSELSQLLTLLINFNTNISRSSNVDLSELSYELLKLGLKREIFNVNGSVRPDFLINFSNLCSEFSNDTEIKSIIKQYKNRLLFNFRESTLNLCNAYIFFYLKDYKKSIGLTKKKPKRTLIFFVHQKIIRIKCIYELHKNEKLCIERDYIGDLLNERKSLKNYLRYKKIDHKPLDNFLNLIIKIIDPNVSKKEMFELVNSTNTPIAAKRWLLRKIEEK